MLYKSFHVIVLHLDFSSLQYNNAVYVRLISAYSSNISISEVVCQDIVLKILNILFLSYG